MGRYTHLTLAEREEIMLMRHEGRSQADIARATGRDRSTIKQGDAQELVPGRRGTLLPGIGRALPTETTRQGRHRGQHHWCGRLGRHRRGEHLRAIRADQMGRQIRAQGNTTARLIR